MKKLLFLLCVALAHPLSATKFTIDASKKTKPTEYQIIHTGLCNSSAIIHNSPANSITDFNSAKTGSGECGVSALSWKDEQGKWVLLADVTKLKALAPAHLKEQAIYDGHFLVTVPAQGAPTIAKHPNYN